MVPVFEMADRIERAAATIKTLVARRVDELRAWERAGFKNAAEFVAAKTGATVGSAKAVLATSEKMVGLPVVEDALRSGTLSATQVAVVSDAAAAAPSQQSRLVEAAQRSSVRELKGECLRTKATVDPDREATARRIHAGRFVRTFVDSEGVWNLVARGTVSDGARIEARLRASVDEEFKTARRNGRRESLEAYTYDVFTRLLTDAVSDTGKEPTLRNLMLLRVDVEALTRGEVKDDEVCEIAGLGPVPVSTARRVLGESIVKLVITRGVDVLNVTHLGRGPTVALASCVALPATGVHCRGVLSHPARVRPRPRLDRHPPHRPRRARTVVPPPPRQENRRQVDAHERQRKSTDGGTDGSEASPVQGAAMSLGAFAVES